MAAGIYIIHNAKNGGIYVGQSRDVKGRWKKHASDLKRGEHPNEGLQADWNEYGAKHFSFKVLEYCDIDQLNDRERHFIKIYLQKGESYNDPNAVPNVVRRPSPSIERDCISLVRDYEPRVDEFSDPLRIQTLYALTQLRTLIANGGSKADMQKHFQQIQENAPKLPKLEDGYLVLAIATQLMQDLGEQQQALENVA